MQYQDSKYVFSHVNNITYAIYRRISPHIAGNTLHMSDGLNKYYINNHHLMNNRDEVIMLE